MVKITYADKLKIIHENISYRKMDNYIFSRKNTGGTYSMRAINGSKKLTTSNKNRITRLYNKYTSLFSDKYSFVNFLPYRLRYKNLTELQLEDYYGEELNSVIEYIDNFKNDNLRFTSEYYLIGVTFYYNPDLEENEIIPVFYSFNGFYNLVNTIKRMDDTMSELGKSTILGSCLRLSDRKILNFDKITDKQWSEMI